MQKKKSLHDSPKKKNLRYSISFMSTDKIALKEWELVYVAILIVSELLILSIAWTLSTNDHKAPQSKYFSLDEAINK